MKSIKLLFFLFLTCLEVFGCAQPNDTTYGKPLVVLTEYNPWSMVIGSDVPTFALYENGHVIYKKVNDRRVQLYEAKLNKEEVRTLITSLSINDSVYKIRDHIEASDWTDQMSIVLKLDLTSKKTISVYGSLNNDTVARKRTPKQLLRIYDQIVQYRNDSAKEWLPQKIEIMFWDYSYAPNKRPWPNHFPDLKSATTVKRGDMYSVYLDKKNFDEFKKFYSSLGEKEAVEVSGQKMAISYRFPFPNIQQ